MADARARPIYDRLELCGSLLGLDQKAQRAEAGGNIAVTVMSKRRAASIRRALLGRGDAHDVFMSPEVGFNKLRDSLAGIDELPQPDRLRTAYYVQAIAQAMHAIALAEARSDRAEVVPGVPRDIGDKCREIIGQAGDKDALKLADPVIDDCIQRGAFGDEGRDKLVAAISAAGAATGKVDQLTSMLAAKFGEVVQEQKARYTAVMAVYSRLGNDMTEGQYNQVCREYNDWLTDVYSPVNDAEGRRLAAARRAGSDAFAEVGRELIAKVIHSSLVAPDVAAKWAAAQTITPQAAARLRKIGYAVENVRADMAEFYRFTGGRVAAVRIHSNGSKRANATDIETHGKVGTINLDSSFDRRVLWHEMAHHMESDPVAKASAGRFIRRRSIDGKAHSLRSLTGSSFYRKDEAAFKGNFFSPYVGKLYRDGVTEVFAMGVESFSNPEMLARRAADDPQTLEFIAGFVKRPMDALARAHMGLREIMREMEEGKDDLVEQFVDQRIADLAAGVRFVEDTDKSWTVGVSSGWMLDDFVQLGYFPGSEGDTSTAYLLKGKVRNFRTGRKVSGLMIVRAYVGGGMDRTPYPTTDINLAKAAMAYYQREGIMPTFSTLNDERKLRAMSS